MAAKDLLFEEVIYQLDSLVKAVDITFKVFFVFNVEYPPEATDVWTFLQKGVFAITTPLNVTPRIKELHGFIKATY